MEHKRYFLRKHNDKQEQESKKLVNNLLNKKRKLSKDGNENSIFSHKFNYKSYVTSFEELDNNINEEDSYEHKKNNQSENYKSYDLIERLKIIMDENNSSEIYKRKAIHIFQTFINYLSKTKHNKEITFSKKIYNKIIIKRIKINDISDFVQFYTGYKSIKTKYNVSIFLRRIARIVNEEPKLNFKKKITLQNKIN